MPDQSIPLKRCTVCGQEKPWDRKYFKWSAEDGIRQPCKACCVANTRDWVVKNWDRAAQNKNHYVQQHPDRVRNSKRTYASSHRQILKEIAWNNRAKYRVKKRQHAKIYYSEHPEKAKIYVLRRRALKRNLPSNFTATDWNICLEYWHYRCAVCGRPRGLWHTIAADHWIPLASPDCPGNVPKNIVPLCHGIDGCNNSKLNKNPEEWLVQRYGKKKGLRIFEQIEAYFIWLQTIENTNQE